MKISIVVAADMTEADEVQRVLATAGIESSLEPVEEEGSAIASDGPCRVLVAAEQQESAIAALQADAEGDEGDDGW